eukprot:m.118631 g.118631  ORF g.118631 m.118631 type:complete len:328 (+) comp13250_c0_seq2:375-1358(+)
MGLTISKIDDGFFICGVEALENTKRLHQLGITHILNVAQDTLYERSYRGDMPLWDALKGPFNVKIMNTDDHARQDLSPLFAEMADFIQGGRRDGGVVVHCAAGISRASTTCIAYMMLKEGLSVNAAFRKVFHVRPQVYPNEGFWRQLRDLESVLLEKGHSLRGLAPGELRPKTAECEEEGGGRPMAFVTSGAVEGDVELTLKQLDNDASKAGSFTSLALTTSVTVSGKPSVVVSTLEEWNKNPKRSHIGIVFANFAITENTVTCRARLIAARTHSATSDVRGALTAALEPTGLMERVDVEGLGAEVTETTNDSGEMALEEKPFKQTE